MHPKLENLQFLGVISILQETLKLIYQWRKIFTQITLSFIIPLSLLNLAYLAISISFFTKTQPSNNAAISSQIIIKFIFNILSTFFTTIFSLLSTATVIYTVACIYTGRDVSFKHVITILPKVWRRVLVTYLCVFVASFGIAFVAILVISLILAIIFSINGSNGFRLDNYYSLIIIFIVTILFVLGSWYFTLIWRLSSEVSVLEGLCGFKAMGRSKALVKGNMRITTKVFVLLVSLSGLIQLVFYRLAIQSRSVWVMCLLGITWVLLFSLFSLVTFVARTVLYFVCRSNHHESVDEFTLSNHLQSYMQADYVPLKDDDQIGNSQIV